LILETVEQAQDRSGQTLTGILSELDFCRATYYRWKGRAHIGRLTDQVVVPQRRALPPTPDEVVAVCDFALAHAVTGYKRLSWLMVDQDVAYLRPYQVYRILKGRDLLARQPKPASEALRRPPAPDHPDQIWHIDLMYLYVHPRWYYLVDIVDGYSRFLVQWSLNLTMEADTVTLTVQEALERLPGRRPGEPRIVHDHGSQFISAEWRRFIEAAGVTDIPTRVAHPQSNGIAERLHRTHRQEGIPEELLTDYYAALDAMTSWDQYYNYVRPHSALQYLCPADYYRGNPVARLAEREAKLARAMEARRAYWLMNSIGKEPVSLT
jgi:transposase InsO family protein